MQSIRTVSFKTLGCRLNQSETDAIETQFQKKGCLVRKFGEPVDLAVVNTCTVTRNADKDSRYAIRQAVRKSKGGRVVVTGCYAQMRPEEIRKIDGVDLVLGNDKKLRLLDHLKSPHPPFVKGGRTRALLKIQDGCDYHCSFCIVPQARGPARSLPFSAIVREAEEMVARDAREIVLTGVNIGTYCSEENGQPRRLVDLVERLAEIDGLARLRISSIEPNTVTDRLLRLMSRSERICPHLHIPIQSASDKILASMGRKYSIQRLRSLLDKILRFLPEAGVGTDVMIGFPGETKRDFETTARFIEEAGFSYLHLFPFSVREETAAAKLAGRVDPREIRRRSEILRGIDRGIRKKFAGRFRGQVLPVLFEQPENGRQIGHTANFLKVRLDLSDNLQGKIENIRLGEPYDYQTISGEIAKDRSDRLDCGECGHHRRCNDRTEGECLV